MAQLAGRDLRRLSAAAAPRPANELGLVAVARPVEAAVEHPVDAVASAGAAIAHARRHRQPQPARVRPLPRHAQPARRSGRQRAVLAGHHAHASADGNGQRPPSAGSRGRAQPVGGRTAAAAGAAGVDVG
ncbi:hypothetical protein G6F24_017051 [Rhizopus arrhizus]|nr:hypothetical protein G6F24_017051 [Rhizopus arrhizus]